MKISYDMSFIANNWSHHGNIMTSLRFLFIFFFLCTRSFFKKSLLSGYVPAIIASIMAQLMNKFYESILEIFWNNFLRIIQTEK